MPRATQFSVVLVTSSQPGVSDAGSGFVIDVDAEAAYVATCAHVVQALAPEEVMVNGRKAEVLRDGRALGLDIAVLRVPGMGDVRGLPLKEFVRAGSSVYGYCFRRLDGEDYVRSRVQGKIARLLSLQGKSAQRSIPAWEIMPGKGYEVVRGNSGAPLIEAKTHAVVGIITHAGRDGRSGIAVSPEAIRLVWPELSDRQRPDNGEPAAPPSVVAKATANGKGKRKNGAGAASGDVPPPLPPPSVSDDPQLGRFGGQSERSGRRLLAEVHGVTEDYFYVDLLCESTDDTPLVGPAFFHLHDTYPRSVIPVRTVDDGGALALRDVYSYGVYTVGCQVRDAAGAWVNLEYPLTTTPGLPRRFHDR